MTLKEVSKMAYDLSLGHYVNDIKYHSVNELYNALKDWLNPESSYDSYIAELCLPDGRWFVKFYRVFGSMYDLYVPDTREQEKKMACERWNMSSEEYDILRKGVSE